MYASYIRIILMNLKFFAFFLTFIFLFSTFGDLNVAHAAVQEINTESYSLTSPEPAKALVPEGIQTMYDFIRTPGDELAVNLRSWTQSAVMTSTEGMLIATICGADFTDENYITQMKADGPNGERQCFETSTWAAAKYGEYGRTPGGLANTVGSTLAYVVEETPIPVDMAYFMDDTFGNTLFGESAYAFKGPFPDGIYEGVFATWKTFRNISVSLLVLILGITGLMVMLRYKISPQVVASVYNTLPYVPIGIAFILLSYPIVTMFLSVIWPLIQFSYNIGMSIAESILPQGGFLDLVAGSVNNVIYRLNPANWASILLATLSMVVVVIVLIAALIKIAFIYARFALYVIASPFVGLIYILPGKQAILVNFLKKLFAEVLTVPLIVLALIIGLSFIRSGSSAAGAGGSSADAWALLTGFSAYWQCLKVIIGTSIIWQSLKVDKMLKESLQVQKGIFYNAPPKR